MLSPQDIEKLLLDKVPFASSLGMKVKEFSKGHIIGHLPFKEELSQEKQTGIFHGGVVTSLVDNLSGMVALSVMEIPAPLVTLDLRIDYLQQNAPFCDIYADVECYKQTKELFFMRGIVYCKSIDEPLAKSMSIFMQVGTQKEKE